MDREIIIKKFYELETREDVAAILEISDKSLRYFLYKRRPENMYHTFELIKKDGSKRTVSAPNKELKAIQKKLAEILSVIHQPKICAYGFIEGRNNIGNAKCHIKKRNVLNIDLKDFFHQIHFGRVRGMLMKPPYSIKEEAATTIAQIACYNGRLPQGAPSSPIITNMICVPLDNALISLAKSTGCNYSRYVDDITFSTYRHEFDRSIVYFEKHNLCIGPKLDSILAKHSFKINPQKVILRTFAQRQEVTGLTVNKFPNVRRSYIKQLRAIIHSCEKYGVLSAARLYIQKGLCKNPIICKKANHPDYTEEILEWFKLVLIGKINYIKLVKGEQSFTYLSFAKKCNDLFAEEVFDLSVLYRFDRIVQNSTFILKYERGMEFVQGSAFYIAKVGLFTSYHVTENGRCYDVYRAQTYDEISLGKVALAVNELCSDKEIDYVIYEPSFSIDETLTFELGDSKSIDIGDQVTVIGYPKHTKGNSPYIQTCYVTSKKNYMGALFYTVSGRIVHGASGGVVLNARHEVIGIIKGGIDSMSEDSENENQGFVPIHLALEHYEQSHS